MHHAQVIGHHTASENISYARRLLKLGIMINPKHIKPCVPKEKK